MGVFTDKRLNGGGPVIDIGVHALDRALWLMGHPDPVSVMAVTFNKFGNRPGCSILGDHGITRVST